MKRFLSGSGDRSRAIASALKRWLPLAEVPEEQMIPPALFGMPTDVVEGD